MNMLGQLPRTPASHFRLHAYGAVLALRARLPPPDRENGLAFLDGYYEELTQAGFAAPMSGEEDHWWELVRAWEREASVHLPLCAARDRLGLAPLALSLLLTVGLGEEDARFARLFEALNGVPAEARPTLGLLATWTDDDGARDALAALLESGLIEAANPEASRSRWALEVPPVIWEALRGRPPGALTRSVAYRACERLPAAETLVFPAELADALRRAPTLLTGAERGAVVVRGPRSSGRHTVVGVLARELGLGVLELHDASSAAPIAGPLAILLQALPVVELAVGAGETVELPRLPGYDGPLAAIAGPRGGITGERALTLELGIPDAGLRARHWRDALGAAGHSDPSLAAELAETMRTTAGTIRRAGRLAIAEAQLAGRARPMHADIRSAMGRLEAEGLETLAKRVPVAGGWDDLAVGPETARELRLLEHRCRARERLHEGVGEALGAQLTPGVRALFSGPSGTGKTLAARLLTASLGKDLFAIDLAAVINKYLGETEKSLEAVFSRAEELDVVLLLDEGDALMTRRTDVQTSNDRYANLETNFLLQRLESYEGILIVTTNAGDRIDSAFRRRLDVVVEFRAPDAAERWSIWQLHLPAQRAIPDAFTEELATRCQLTGAQIRNAVLHASLLALEDDAPLLDADHLEQAVRREYRKAGSVCPLRGAVLAGG